MAAMPTRPDSPRQPSLFDAPDAAAPAADAIDPAGEALPTPPAPEAAPLPLPGFLAAPEPSHADAAVVEIQWLNTDPNIAKIVVIIVNLWVGIPYTILSMSGILMNIPEDLYESARIDGAGPVKTFTSITLPYMLFVTTPQLITQFVGNINNFNVIYLLTGGGPTTEKFYQAGYTDILVTWLFKLTMNSSDYNLAAAIGIIVFIICAVLSLIVFNSSKSAKDEEAFS